MILTRSVLLYLGVVLSGCYMPTAVADDSNVPYSDIKSDEHVVFFRTAASFDEATQEWRIPIHGWIYEPEDSTARKSTFSRTLERLYDLEITPESEANFSRRVNLLIADNERGKHIAVFLGGQKYVLPASSPNGHFETALTIPVADAAKFAADGLVKYTAITKAGEARTFSGEVRLVGPTGLSVISDIDDTVKISNVTDRRRLLENTFLLDFEAVPGMAELYRRWSQQGVSFHFVSSSPWQLYSPLGEFLDDGGFPWSTFSLKAIRFRDETFFDLFKKGTETKPAAIEKILGAFAGRDFLLVGDSGEQDPEAYAALWRKHPDQVKKIYIRNVTNESADDPRFQSVFDGVPADCWQLFDDPATLTLPK